MRVRLKSALYNLKQEKGAALPIVLIVLLLAGLMIVPLLKLTGTGMVSGELHQTKSYELYAADAGAYDALWLLGSLTAEEFAAQCVYDPETLEYTYVNDLPEPINGKTVHYEITTDAGGYIIKSTATGPDGSSTTVEVWAKQRVPPNPLLFALACLDGDLTLNATDIGTPPGSVSIPEVLGTADGTATDFELRYKRVVEGSETVYVGAALQTRGEDEDYTIDYENGVIQFNSAPISTGTDQAVDEVVGIANGTATDFYLDYSPVTAESETVYVGGVLQIRDIDYTVDYENGLIQFTSAPDSSVHVAGEAVGSGDGSTTVFYLDYSPVVALSETVLVGGVPQIRDIDYTITNTTGRLQFLTAPGRVTGEAVGTGNGSTTVFYLDHFPVVELSEMVYVGGVLQTQGVLEDYTINYTNGQIEFTTAPFDGHIAAEAVGTGDGFTTDFDLDHSPVVALSETVLVGGVPQIRDTDYTIDYANGQLHFITVPGQVTGEAVGTGDGTTTVFGLAHSPVIAESEIVTVGGAPQTRDIDYTINNTTGQINFFTAPGIGAVIGADYRYSAEILATYDCSGEITASYGYSVGIEATYDYYEEITATYEYWHYEEITATYDYLANHVNIYANGDIHFDGSVVAYANCYLTLGHNVYGGNEIIEPGISGSPTWYGTKNYTLPLTISPDVIPDDPYPADPDTYWPGDVKNADIAAMGGQLGPIHIAGDLSISSGAVVTLQGTVWVEGKIKITGGSITGEDPDGGLYYMIANHTSKSPNDPAVTVLGGDPIEAIFWTPNGYANLAGNEVLNGAALAFYAIDLTGTGDIQNSFPLEEAPTGTYPSDVLSWKIY
ncbi:hypothetical protein ACFLXA_06490 [Chloroflexota bacterium]